MIFRLLFGLLILGSCTVRNDTDRTAEVTPLKRLLEGNQRYLNFHSIHPHQNRARLKEITDEQNPFAVVICCSDSRVPPEIIFDQGLGDLFVIRTAGNVMGDYELASIEYAILRLNCSVIMIMGHEGCGAIQAFLDQQADSLPGHLNALIDFIKTQPYTNAILEEKETGRNYRAVISNIIYGVNFIKKESPVILKKFEAQELEIVGAVYQLKSGKVQVISDEIRNHLTPE